MKRFNKKFLISFIALLMISFSSFAMLSFTLADEENGTAESKVLAAGQANDNHLDRIIDNSNEKADYRNPYTNVKDKNYNVLEISSSANHSKLETLISNGKFKEFVIEGYKSDDNPDLMAADTIKYEFHTVTEADDVLIEAIKKADFIYIANDPTSLYSAAVDFKEDVKTAVVNAATVDYKPVMIDGYQRSQNIGNNNQKTIAKLISQELAKVKTKYKQSPSDLLVSGSSTHPFTPIHGDTQKAKWAVDATTNETTAYVLTIGASDMSLTGGLNNDGNWTKLKTDGYFGWEDKPDHIVGQTASVTDLSAINPADLGAYDYIIIEKSAGDPSVDVYNKLAAAAIGGVHILYDDSYYTSSSSTIGTNPAPGYAYILDKVATADETSRFANVLISDASRTEIFSNAPVKKTVKDISDIIINGSYRGISGNNSGGESSTVYTVLEIEPSYPIDLDLAAAIKNSNILGWTDAYASSFANGDKKKFLHTMGRDGTTNNEQSGLYYVRNSGVKTSTADEIDLGDGVALSDYPTANRVAALQARIQQLQNDNGKLCDYYNWTLSNAKIAHAAGFKRANEVNVVHMSTYEFNTSTKSLLDNYDAIYIGGDNSGVKTRWNNGNQYTMYFKYGDTYGNQWSQPFGSDASGKLVGNDINDLKLKELQEYAKKLPVIVDYKASEAIASSTLIDPTSNMYAFLTGIQAGAKTLWGFRSDETIKIANDENLWGTNPDYATVFAGEEQYDYQHIGDAANQDQYYHNGHNNETKLKAALATQRPKLVLTSRPAQFILGDSSTELSANDLKWDYKVPNGNNVTVNLYIDDDANSRFDTTSEKRGSVTGASGTLSVTLDSDYYGPVYWKVEAVSGDISTSVVGLAKIKRTTQDKMKVDLLQIMPDLGFSDTSLVTLYLCTECQQARGLLTKGNYTIQNLHKYHKQAICSMSNGYKDNPFSTLGTAAGILNGQTTVATAIDSYEGTYTAEKDWKFADHGNNLGIHDHKFGIVEYFHDRSVYNNKAGTSIDSEGGAQMTGVDDWNMNWFDDIRYDYDVDVDLLNITQYQNLCAKVNNFYNGCSNQAAIDSKRQTFAEERDAFKNYYDCMVEVINGVYYTSQSKIDSTVKAEFEDMLLRDMKLGASFDSNGQVTYKTTGLTATDVTNMLKGYAAAAAKCDSFLTTNRDVMAASNKIQTYTQYAKDEFDYEASSAVTPDEKKYYDFFNMWSDDNEEAKTYSPQFARIYIPWRDAKALEQYFYQKYVTDRALSSVTDDPTDPNFGKFDLTQSWNCIAIGAAEKFGQQDINELGCRTLLNYINNDGSVLLFHDTLTLNNLASGSGTPTMTKILASAFGMSGNSDSSGNYITDGNGFPVTGTTLTTRDILYKSKDNQSDPGFMAMWKHVQFDYQAETNNQMVHGAHDCRRAIAQEDGMGGTDKAAQNNQGIITLYPFQISSRLQISVTNGQGYVANVADPNMTVYYSLEGGSPGTYSSMFAADPQDGINNYFLYQYGKVTYTGAGHSNITGLGRNNNDERKLFINVIVNAARKSTVGPALNLYDYDSTIDDLKNKVIQEYFAADSESATGEDAAEYITYVRDINDKIEFSFLPTLQGGATIKDIKIWYDVATDGTKKNEYNPTDGDVLIYKNTEAPAENVTSGKLKKINDNTGPTTRLEGYQVNADGSIKTNLDLKETYFKEGKYAFIVVQLKDSKDKWVTKTLRIEYKPELLDLN